MPRSRARSGSCSTPPAATRTPSAASSSPTAASCTRTATGCSARSTTPRTRSRRRCCAPGAGCARFEGRSSLRVLALHDRDEHLPRPDRAAAEARAAGRLRPAADPHGGPGEPLRRVGLDRALPRRDARASRTARRARRRATSSARASSSRSSPRSSTCPRNQRAVLILREVLGFSAQEVGGRARHHRRLGEQRAAARPQDGRGARCPSRASRRRCARSATSALREIVERYVEAWERGDVEAVVAMLAEDAAFSMPPLATWFGGARRSRSSSPAGRCRAPGAGARCPRSQRPAGARLLQLGPRRRRTAVRARTC